MSWANRVLPVFMAASSGIKPGRLPEAPVAVQIDTTLHRFKSRSNSGFPVHGAQFNRTLLIWFHDKQHPLDLGARQVEAFLTDLAVTRKVSASTQNQALAALLFLYKEVLGIDLPWLDDVVRAKKPQRLPVVLTVVEVQRLLARLEGSHGLMAQMLYGTGMRLMECVRLRVKDVNFGRNEIIVRDGKGGKDRVTMLPASLAEPLKEHLKRVRVLFEQDRAEDVPGVYLPDALEKKYPNAGKE